MMTLFLVAHGDPKGPLFVVYLKSKPNEFYYEQ